MVADAAPTGRVGVMGGTFDPIHNGHLAAAAAVADQLLLTSVVFVPTGRPWQKAGTPVSSAADRLAMTELAVLGDPRFSVSRVDVDRDGPTYTVDTLADLLGQLSPDVELCLIIGADSLATIRTWRDFERVATLAHLVGVSRPGHTLVRPDLADARVTLLEVRSPAISSTQIRRLVAAGQPIGDLVPAPVADHIHRRGLYR